MSSSLPLKFAVLFSLSIAGAAVAPFSFPRKTTLKSYFSFSPETKPKATVSDLLSLLGPPDQARSVNSQIAQDLWSCFKFLVPYNETLPARRSLSSKISTPSIRSGKDIDELILSPPPAILELARLAFDSGGDPGAIHRALDPTIIPVSISCLFLPQSIYPCLLLLLSCIELAYILPCQS